MTIAHRVYLLAKQTRMRSAEIGRRLWLKYAIRDARFADRHERMDTAYKVEDPWQMNSARERFRFQRTNKLIEENFPARDQVLEIGCGEGHQTEYLSRLCPSLYGIDVSATAVRRARKRLPQVTFAICDLATQPFVSPPDTFDLIVACEVLYYIKDIPAAIATMERLGRACLVTYYEGSVSDQTRVALDRIPNTSATSFSFGDTTWHALWWTPAAPAAPAA